MLSGAGERAFTAGLDVTAASSEGPLSGEGGDLDPARKAKALRGHIEEFQNCISEMEKCEKRKCSFFFLLQMATVFWNFELMVCVLYVQLLFAHFTPFH